MHKRATQTQEHSPVFIFVSIKYAIFSLSYNIPVIKSRKLRWALHVARMEEGRNAFKILTGIPTGKRPLGRPRRIWKDNIRMDLEGIKGIGLIRLRIGIIGEPL